MGTLGSLSDASGSSEKAMSVIAAPRRTNSIALSRHWKQILSNRFQLVVSSDLRSQQQCGKTKFARVEWRDFDANGRMLLIRNRKDPRRKKGNETKSFENLFCIRPFVIRAAHQTGTKEVRTCPQ